MEDAGKIHNRPARPPAERSLCRSRDAAAFRYCMDASLSVVMEHAGRNRYGLMRKEWRNVLAILILPLLGTGTARAQPDEPKVAIAAGEENVRLTIEVNWGITRDKGTSVAGGGQVGEDRPALEFSLELTSGRVLEAVRWPAAAAPESASSERATDRFGPGPAGTWRLGHVREGRVRARIEAPLEAAIVVRGGDQVVNMPLAAILEKAQRTPPQSTLMVSVERLAWDVLQVDFGEPAAGGIVSPGSVVPVSIGLNILSPDATGAAVRTTALSPARGGEAVWRSEPREREVVATNAPVPVARTLHVVAPQAEGTYVLEISASWDLAQGREGSRIGA